MDSTRLAWLLFAGWLSIITMMLLCFMMHKMQMDQLEQKIDRHTRRASAVYDQFINKSCHKRRRI